MPKIIIQKIELSFPDDAGMRNNEAQEIFIFSKLCTSYHSLLSILAPFGNPKIS
jgi:hypothetical protein